MAKAPTFAALLSFGVAAALLAACSGAQRAGGTTLAQVGRPAPNWSEPTAAGGTLSLAALRGKAVYLNFFASWCPPCNDEAPRLEALQRRYGPQGLQIVGVDVLESRAKAAHFVAEHHLTYPAVVDAGTLRDQYAVNGLPVHVFITRGGVVKRIAVGELSEAQMRRGIESILGS